MSTKPSIAEVSRIISGHLKSIAQLFVDPTITLVVRNGDNPEQDFVVTAEDDLLSAIEVLYRRKARESETKEK